MWFSVAILVDMNYFLLVFTVVILASAIEDVKDKFLDKCLDYKDFRTFSHCIMKRSTHRCYDNTCINCYSGRCQNTCRGKECYRCPEGNCCTGNNCNICNGERCCRTSTCNTCARNCNDICQSTNCKENCVKTCISQVSVEFQSNSSNICPSLSNCKSTCMETCTNEDINICSVYCEDICKINTFTECSNCFSSCETVCPNSECKLNCKDNCRQEKCIINNSRILTSDCKCPNKMPCQTVTEKPIICQELCLEKESECKIDSKINCQQNCQQPIICPQTASKCVEKQVRTTEPTVQRPFDNDNCRETCKTELCQQTWNHCTALCTKTSYVSDSKCKDNCKENCKLNTCTEGGHKNSTIIAETNSDKLKVANQTNTIRINSYAQNINKNSNNITIGLTNKINNVNNISNPISIKNINIVHTRSESRATPAVTSKTDTVKQVESTTRKSLQTTEIPVYVSHPVPMHYSCYFQRKSPYFSCNINRGCMPCFYCQGSYNPQFCSRQAMCSINCQINIRK